MHATHKHLQAVLRKDADLAKVILNLFDSVEKIAEHAASPRYPEDETGMLVLITKAQMWLDQLRYQNE